jgi:DNA-binding Lrp family transcriptional regulator
MKTLDRTNANIISALSRHGPRNLSLIAESVGLPNSTLAFRIKQLVERLDLEVNARVNFNKLGLMRAIVLAETLPGQWTTLWKSMENLGCLTYLTKCYGVFYGCYGIFAFPAKEKGKLEEYFEEAKRQDTLSNATVFWTTNLCEVHPDFEWFDFGKREWIFHWKEWIEEAQDAEDALPENLSDPEEYPIMADKTDMLLLRQLERNGLTPFNELSKIVGISERAVAYRYKKHLIERKLIVDHMVHFYPYPYNNANACTFIIHFPDRKKLAKFANSLSNKPFMMSYAKVLERNTLVANTYIPGPEFPRFIESLDLLTEMKMITSFSHITLTLIPHKRGGVPYELFENNTWRCDANRTLTKLKTAKNS